MRIPIITLAATVFGIGVAVGAADQERPAPYFGSLGESLGAVELPGDVAIGAGPFAGIGDGLAVEGAPLVGEGSPCMTRDELAAALEDEYSETPLWYGLSIGGGLVELFASPSGSWSLVVTKPGGQCSTMIGAGRGSQLAMLGEIRA